LVRCLNIVSEGDGHSVRVVCCNIGVKLLSKIRKNELYDNVLTYLAPS